MEAHVEIPMEIMSVSAMVTKENIVKLVRIQRGITEFPLSIIMLKRKLNTWDLQNGCVKMYMI